MEPDVLWHFQELMRRMAWMGEQQLKLERQLLALEAGMQALGQQVAALEEQIAGMGDRPSTHIDKIEYRFEQLKVDTLAGTLQIGISHNAEGLIEDLAVQESTAEDIKLGAPSDNGGELFLRIASGLQQYANTELYLDIDEAAARSGINLNPELRERIADDLTKQLQNRAVSYMKEVPTREGPDPAAEKAILTKVKADVRSGLKQYFEQDGKEASP